MGHSAIITKHVDDFGIMSKSSMLIQYIKSKLSEIYEITVDPIMQFYLGYHITRNRAQRTLTLSQEGYIDELISKYDIEIDNNYPNTPMEYLTSLDSSKGTLLDARGITDYQSRVGSILYLAIMSRPDFLYVTAILSSKNKSPTTEDLKAVNRVLSYIVGTRQLGLVFGSDNGVTLYATVDASNACHDDFKSHSGCTLHVGSRSGSIITVSKKQSVTADSSTIAEFIATHIITKEIMWARSLLAS